MKILHKVYRCFVTCCMLQQQSKIVVITHTSFSNPSPCTRRTNPFFSPKNSKASIGLQKTCTNAIRWKVVSSLHGEILCQIQAFLPSKHFIHKLNHKLKFDCHLIRHNKFVDVTKWLGQQKRYQKNPKNCAHRGEFEDDGQS